MLAFDLNHLSLIFITFPYTLYYIYLFKFKSVMCVRVLSYVNTNFLCFFFPQIKKGVDLPQRMHTLRPKNMQAQLLLLSVKSPGNLYYPSKGCQYIYFEKHFFLCRQHHIKNLLPYIKFSKKWINIKRPKKIAKGYVTHYTYTKQQPSAFYTRSTHAAGYGGRARILPEFINFPLATLYMSFQHT